MIDKRYQQKGYGCEALKKIIVLFKEEGADEVKLSFEKENKIAEKLYTKLGFRRTRNLYDEEIEMILKIV